MASPNTRHLGLKWRQRPPSGVLVPLMLLASISPSLAQTAVRVGSRSADGTKTDVTFARIDGHVLKLDYYPPDNRKFALDQRENHATPTARPPLIVWVHGGAWRRGSKESVPILPLQSRNYAIASLEYRLSETAKFPAQVLDIKSAIQFLVGHSDEFGFDANRIFIAGASAGGHLAALVGVSSGVPDLESPGAEPIRLAGIVSLYGASNLASILEQTRDKAKREFRAEALRMLLGTTPAETPRLTTLASPTAHLTSDDPPIFLIHGDADIQMPIAQSTELHAAYHKADLRSRLFTVVGAGHGGKAFYTPEMLDVIDSQLKSW